MTELEIKQTLGELLKLNKVQVVSHNLAIKQHWTNKDFFRINIIDRDFLCSINEKREGRFISL